MTCPTCTNLQPCVDHPEALVGTRWENMYDDFTITVMQPVTDRPGCWVVEDNDVMLVLTLDVFDDFTRLPEPDFAAIIHEAAIEGIDSNGHYDRDVTRLFVLAATVPALCGTCGGTAGMEEGCPRCSLGICSAHQPCLYCPTIAKLLAVGAAVMTLDLSGDEGHISPTHINAQQALVDYLRAVQP